MSPNHTVPFKKSTGVSGGGNVVSLSVPPANVAPASHRPPTGIYLGAMEQMD